MLASAVGIGAGVLLTAVSAVGAVGAQNVVDYVSMTGIYIVHD
jgi:hypothetical protein